MTTDNFGKPADHMFRLYILFKYFDKTLGIPAA